MRKLFTMASSSFGGPIKALSAAVMVASAIVCLASSVQAQAFRGLRLDNTVGTKDANVFQDANFGGPNSLKDAWGRRLPQLNQLVQTKIADINRNLPGLPKLPSGVTIYEQKSTLSKNLVVTMTFHPKGITVKAVVKRNVLIFKTTTPTVFGSYADPKFSLTYDLEFVAEILLPSTIGNPQKNPLDGLFGKIPNAGPLKVGSARVSMTNVSWDSQNFTGDLVKLANSVRKLFTGKDFMAKLNRDQSINIGPEVNGLLIPLNKQLVRLKAQGFRTMQSAVDPKTRVLKLTVKK